MKRLLALTLIFVAVGCNVQTQESQKYLTSGYVSGKSQTGYEFVNQAVFSTSCVYCHNGQTPSGGVNLDTYSHVMGNLGAVKTAACLQAVVRSQPPTSMHSRHGSTPECRTTKTRAAA
ncbi:MAG: hypothetical protein JST80_13170 [Bdellovibrionales bacterium]|nr:hypothetical protein [Bdellovibrionales bacterium]